MSKHRLSPSQLPPAKRLHWSGNSKLPPSRSLGFIDALYDEIILCIFSHLSWIDLCVSQSTSRNWARLAEDNELWRTLYLKAFGRTRLRGARGFLTRLDGREVKPLPGRAKSDQFKNWKWMFRISSNWRKGRCHVTEANIGTKQQDVVYLTPPISYPTSPTHILLAGVITITAASTPTSKPMITLSSPHGNDHHIHCSSSFSGQGELFITALGLDQSPPASSLLSLVCFLSTGEFSIVRFSPTSPSNATTSFISTPARRSTNLSHIIQTAYYHPVLVALSDNFILSIYDLSSGTVQHTQSLSSFTSYPPSSLVLSAPSPTTFKVVLAYSVPVYPNHWSVGATELIISRGSEALNPSTSPFASPSSFSEDFRHQAHGFLRAIGTRTIRAIDVPPGWIDERRLRLMREQWARKVSSVADIQTDGKWLVLAPGEGPSFPPVYRGHFISPVPHNPDQHPHLHSPTGLQLYRLVFPTSMNSMSQAPPKVTFVRMLHGQMSSVSALAVADGRCISLGNNGSIWVWDLEGGTGAEVASSNESLPLNHVSVSSRGCVSFDERQIVTAHAGKFAIRRFDI